jgi:hypothetical protein
MPVLAGRSLEGLNLLQVPVGHDLGQEPVGLADPCLSGLYPGFGAMGLGVDRRNAGMLAELGRLDPFEAEEVEPDTGPAQFAIEGLDRLQDALGAMEMTPAHGSDADDWGNP